jgi:hypothetical protein
VAFTCVIIATGSGVASLLPPEYTTFSHMRSLVGLSGLPKFLRCYVCLLLLLSTNHQCECPRDEKHVKYFIKKYPGADGIFGLVDVEPGNG